MYYLSYGGLEYNIAYDITDFDQFVANLKTTTHNDDRQTLTRWSGGVQWDMFDMAGGTAAIYLGAEYYEIKYQALAGTKRVMFWRPRVSLELWPLSERLT